MILKIAKFRFNKIVDFHENFAVLNVRELSLHLALSVLIAKC